MPRGRHRHSPPLHRLLPPSVLAGVSLACAAVSWLFSLSLVLRLLTLGATLCAVVAAVVMRRWDRVAGRRVAELERELRGAEWRHEERVAELEADLEDSRRVRVRYEHKLRTKRSELAQLRGEHAALLQRYARAETERAGALEGRRVLEIEAAGPARALTAGPSAAPSTGSDLYREATAALDRLAGEAPKARGTPAPRSALPSGPPSGPGGGVRAPRASGAGALGPVRSQNPGGPLPTRNPGTSRGPHAPQGPQGEAGFDFFGARAEPTPAALEAAHNSDLADVVGEEVLAEQQAAPAPAAPEPAAGPTPAPSAARSATGRAVGHVIDLTAHDDTEPLDLSGLRRSAS